MDYLRTPLGFKIKKVVRYATMYGVSRTYIKVVAQLHMRRKFARLPAMNGRVSDRQTVGIIGCGNYSFSTIAYYLRQAYGDVIAICMDRNADRAASMSKYYDIPVYTTDPAEVFDNEQVQLVYIASNHASHADYAIEALRKGKQVYVEKPHVVSDEQLASLVDTMGKTQGRVFLGFNRPRSRFGRIIQEYLRREGGPGMYNWFVAGHAIEPDHWYFRPEEGGRVLGNLCHWTDFVLRLVPKNAHPIRINPTTPSRRDTDLVVTYVFNDETIAAISFSAKGHAFEGVKERFSAQKGNCLISMDDYRWLMVEVVDKKRRWFNVYRDHGHRANILAAYENVTQGTPYDHGERQAYVWDTGWLFLRTREALEKDAEVVAHSFQDRLSERA